MGNPKKVIAGKIYTRSGQGWRDKRDALRGAKSMRSIGYKARVQVDNEGWYRVYYRE